MVETSEKETRLVAQTTSVVTRSLGQPWSSKLGIRGVPFPHTHNSVDDLERHFKRLAIVMVSVVVF